MKTMTGKEFYDRFREELVNSTAEADLTNIEKLILEIARKAAGLDDNQGKTHP